MKKLIAAAILMTSMAFAAQDAQPQAQQLQADPLVSALNQLVEKLSADETVPGNSLDKSAAARDKKDTAVAVGTAAAIGSALGALIAKEDRAKGAAIGAAVGGIVGLIYDRMQVKKENTATTTPAMPEPQTVPAAPSDKKVL